MVDLMVKIMPDTGILVEHNNEGIFMRNGIGHKLLICRTIVGQLLFGMRVTAEDVKPAQHIIVIWVGTGTGMRISTPYITKLVITTADIDGDTGIINRFHYFYPGSEIRFEFVWVDCLVAGNQVTGEYNKIDALAFNLGSKLAEDDLIDSIDVTAAVAGNNEFPGLLRKSCRRKCRQKKNGKNKLYMNCFFDSPFLLKKNTFVSVLNVIVCYVQVIRSYLLVLCTNRPRVYFAL